MISSSHPTVISDKQVFVQQKCQVNYPSLPLSLPPCSSSSCAFLQCPVHKLMTTDCTSTRIHIRVSCNALRLLRCSSVHACKSRTKSLSSLFISTKAAWSSNYESSSSFNYVPNSLLMAALTFECSLNTPLSFLKNLRLCLLLLFLFPLRSSSSQLA